MDFRLNDEQELFVDGVRELMASEKLGSFISHSVIAKVNTQSVLLRP